MPTSEGRPADAPSTDEGRLLFWLSEQYPEGVRKLADGSIAAIYPLLTTTSVLLGLDRWGWSRRFCFESPIRAREVFNALESEDDEPVGYIARR